MSEKYTDMDIARYDFLDEKVKKLESVVDVLKEVVDKKLTARNMTEWIWRILLTAYIIIFNLL